MVEYGRALAAADGLEVRYECADMTSFSLGERFDLTVLLLNSATYLLSNDAVLQHLNSVADHLGDGGVSILELSHPRDVFGVGRSTMDEWECERDGIHVRIRWGREDDPLDPIRQVRRVTTELEYTAGSESGSFVDQMEERLFTWNEVQALIAASGRFRVAETFGALDLAVPFDNQPRAWRMVLALEKLPTT